MGTIHRETHLRGRPRHARGDGRRTTDSATRPSGYFTQKSDFCVGKTPGTDLGFSGEIRDLRIFKAVVNITQLVDP